MTEVPFYAELDPPERASESGVPPRVVLAPGDVLSEDADVMVLPGTAQGTFGEPWYSYLVQQQVRLPVRNLRLGTVRTQRARRGSRVSHLAFAATVPGANGRSTPEVVEQLAGEIGRLTTELDAHVVVAPLLGTGVGALDPASSLDAMARGFLMHARASSVLRVVVVDERTLDELGRRAPSGVEVESYEPGSSPSSEAAPSDPSAASRADAASAGRTALVHDQPAAVDQLGRAVLAAEVASLLRELAEQHERPEAFAVHLDAPWGAGKSSLVRFIADDLAGGERRGGRRERADDRWVIIELDAWRESQLSPAWWSVLAHLRTGVRGSLGWWQRRRFDVSRLGRALRRLWRVWLPALVVLGALAWLWGMRVDIGGVMQEVTAVVAFVAAIGALGSRFLSLGSLQGARLHERLNDNPMEEIAEQIWQIRGLSRSTVLLVLDDLDRCNEKFTVELLDTVQTLLRRGPDTRTRRSGRAPMPALVVLAVGDGRWLRAAYEHQYAVFTSSVSEPGRPLGHLFLDKLFQLRIELPRLSVDQVSAYLAGLLGSDDATARAAVDPGLLEGRITDAPTAVPTDASSLDEHMAHLMTEASGLPPAQRQHLADVAMRVRREDSRRNERQHHLLERYADLLDPNPRAAKRFLMAYNVAFAARLAEPGAVDPQTLALWTVLSTRWPALAEWLRGQLPGGSLDPVDAPGHASLLLSDAQVGRVLDARERGGPLDRARMLRCCGYSDAP